jgi:hypothetical protein
VPPSRRLADAAFLQASSALPFSIRFCHRPDHEPRCETRRKLQHVLKANEVDFMRQILRAPIAALTLFVLAVSAGAAFAQAQQAVPQDPPQLKQIALNDRQVQNLLAAQKDMDAITTKLPEGTTEPDAKVQAELDAAAKKNGFASYDEYGEVLDNVSLVLSGIDPKTKAFSEPPVMVKKQIAEVTADKKMSAEAKKATLADLNAALKFTSNVQYPDNVKIVTKYYDQLSAAFLGDAE